MNHSASEVKYKLNLRLVFTAASILLGLWFFYHILNIVFLFFLAIVLTLILNAPTMWLISKKMSRTVAAMIVFFIMMVFLFLIGFLVVPRILVELSSLVAHIPDYLSELRTQLSPLLKDYPSLQKSLSDNTALQSNLPSAGSILASLGRISFSLIDSIFLLIIFFSIVIYMLINPTPLIESYLLLFPFEKREKAALALSKASTMMVGWMRSNLIVGAIEAVASYLFLSFMAVPGVWVWAGLAIFAELVPKLGLYIMAFPPILIALSISPATALWVLVFYLVLNEITGNIISPRIRATTMDLHPVSTILAMIALASAFGVIGALISTPITAFIKAFYETFYLSATSKENINEQIDVVLSRKDS